MHTAKRNNKLPDRHRADVSTECWLAGGQTKRTGGPRVEIIYFFCTVKKHTHTRKHSRNSDDMNNAFMMNNDREEKDEIGARCAVYAVARKVSESVRG